MVLATLSGKAKRRPEAGEESITTHWATLDEAVQLVLNGGMVHGPSAMTLLQYKLLQSMPRSPTLGGDFV